MVNDEKLYSASNIRTIIKEGVYKRRKWFICSVGTHPCVYVRITKKETALKWEEMPIDVHGGITYQQKKPKLSNSYKNQHIDVNPLIGWDYRHGNDFYYKPDKLDNISNSRVWTIKELENEVLSVIDQMEELKQKNYVIV